MLVALAFLLVITFGSVSSFSDDTALKNCPNALPVLPEIARENVYKSVPFKEGESAKYELKYGVFRILVGYGLMRVAPPSEHEIVMRSTVEGEPLKIKRNHMVFESEAFTGDWYRMIFRGSDKIRALSRPWDFGISHFYIDQDEEKPFVRREHMERWLDYEHENCLVKIFEKDYVKKKEYRSQFDLEYGATDALGAIYRLRSYDFVIGKPQRFLVYSSKKNWILEANPIKKEIVMVKAGTFETVKLLMKTYIGEDLNQKGALEVWIASDHSSHPLVKAEGEAVFGKFYLYLNNFKGGN